MHKFTKISLSLLIVFSMVLNPFSSIFDIKASAVSPEVLMYLEQAGYAFFGMIVTAVGGTILGEQLEQLDQALQDRARATYAEIQAPIEQGGSPLVFTSRWSEYEREMMIEQGHITNSQYGVVCSISPSANLTDEQTKFYQAFVDSFNSSGVIAETSYVSGGIPQIKAQDYVNIKNDVTNSFIKQAYDSAVTEMGQSGVLPLYNFDFVGPQPSISAPVVNGMATLQKDGFEYTVPTSIILREFNGSYFYYYSSEASAKAAGCDEVRLWYADPDTGTEYWTGTITKTAYGAGLYVLYNGEIYYRSSSGFVASGNSFNVAAANNTISNFSNYKSLDGTPLSSVYNGGDFKVGAVFNTTGAVQSTIPTVSVSEGEFTQQIGGGSVDVSRSDVEDIIGKAMELGLAVPDSWIQFAQDGSISSVDGIELSKLQELIDAVTAGNLGFENMQEYLDLLSKLVAAGNLTASQQKTLVDNISKAITAEHTLEDVEFENSYLTVEHTGFKEAKTLVDKLPIINQSKTLLNNLFETTKNREQNNNNVPNFSFYWDSNDDGVKEKYTLMDLSFMEQRLSNSNLVDKGRYSSSMTIRDFVQSLIVLIAYSMFAIKLLKRLPAFFGGASSGAESIDSTFDSIRR